MPLLGGLVVALATQFGSLFALWFTQKAAIGLAAVATLATIVVALLVAMRAVVSPLLAQLFATEYGQFLGLAFPPIAGTCLAAIATTWAACTLYSWQKKGVELFTAAT